MSNWTVDDMMYSPGQWAYKEFEAWAQQAELDRNFQPGQAKHIIEVFDKALKSADQRGVLSRVLNDLEAKKLITRGNRQHIEQKGGRIFHHLRELHQRSQAPQATPGAPRAAPRMPQRPIQPINIQRIEQIARTKGYVWFYKSSENPTTECFGNYHTNSVPVLGNRTSEGAFLALKYGFDPTDPRNPFKDLTEAGDALYKLNMKLEHDGRPAWKTIDNVSAMKHVLAAKYLPGTPEAAALLATGNAYLVEHSARDSFWGDGGDGSGRNMLGTLLMELRANLGGTGVVAKPANYLRDAPTLH